LKHSIISNVIVTEFNLFFVDQKRVQSGSENGHDGKRSCHRKPPAHPPSSNKPPKAPPASADQSHQPCPVSAQHTQRQQSSSVDAEDALQQPVAYDESIWDFLPHDSGTNDLVSGMTSGSQQRTQVNSNNHNVDLWNEVTWVDKKSVEQIEAVREIIKTEISYGNDLAIIRNVRGDIHTLFARASIKKV